MKRVATTMITVLLTAVIVLSNVSGYVVSGATTVETLTRDDILSLVQEEYNLDREDINYVYFTTDYPISVDFKRANDSTSLASRRTVIKKETSAVVYNMYVIAENYTYITYTKVYGKVSSDNYRGEHRYLVFNRFCTDHFWSGNPNRTGIELDAISEYYDNLYINADTGYLVDIDWYTTTTDAGVCDNGTTPTKHPTVSNVKSDCIYNTMRDFNNDFEQHGYDNGYFKFDKYFKELHDYFWEYSNIENRKINSVEYESLGITYPFSAVDVEVSPEYISGNNYSNTTTTETETTTTATTTEETIIDVDPTIRHLQNQLISEQEYSARLEAELAELKQKNSELSARIKEVDEIYAYMDMRNKCLEQENELLRKQIEEMTAIVNDIQSASTNKIPDVYYNVGDCNGDGKVSIVDVVVLCRYLAGTVESLPCKNIPPIIEDAD